MLPVARRIYRGSKAAFAGGKCFLHFNVPLGTSSKLHNVTQNVNRLITFSYTLFLIRFQPCIDPAFIFEIAQELRRLNLAVFSFDFEQPLIFFSAQ